jgi:hypothetical protein
MSRRSRHSRRSVPTRRCAMALASGVLIGVGMISDALGPKDLIQSPRVLRVAVADQEPERKRLTIDPTRLRACWVTQAGFGFDVTPPRYTWREPISMKKSRYRRRKKTVSTVRRSQATMPAA